jgi:hypothetical protein
MFEDQPPPLPVRPLAVQTSARRPGQRSWWNRGPRLNLSAYPELQNLPHAVSERWFSTAWNDARKKTAWTRALVHASFVGIALVCVAGAWGGPRIADGLTLIGTAVFTLLVVALVLDHRRFAQALRSRLAADLEGDRFQVCVECEYDLRGSPGDACPECGAPILISEWKKGA